MAGTLVEEAERLGVEAAARSWAPYPEYRESGADWLGRVPFHWQAKRLKHAVDLINEKIEDANGLPYIGLEHIESWTGRRIESETPVSPDGFACRFGMGDVLFGKLRPYLAKVHLAEEPGVCTAEALVLRPKFVRADYLRYYVLARQFIEVVDGSTYGSKMPRANWQFIGCLPCLVPSVHEQRAIAVFLDRKTRQIDELIAKKRRLIELLQEKRTALISHAVTKGLDSDAPMKPSGVDWLGEVPAHWEVKRIKFIARVGNGSTPKRDNTDYWGGEYPWLNSGVVNLHEVTEASDFVTDLALEECHLPIVRPPAVLVGITGEGKTRGMVTILRVEATINQHLAFVRPTVSDCDVEFLRYVLHAAYQFLRDESGGGGSTKGALTCEQLGNVAVPFPPPGEQCSIVAELERACATLDLIAATTESATDQLAEYRQAVISAAVTGKIDVREEVQP